MAISLILPERILSCTGEFQFGYLLVFRQEVFGSFIVRKSVVIRGIVAAVGFNLI